MREYSYFLKKTWVNNTNEVNLLSLPIGMLKQRLSRPPKYYMLSEAYIGRFDLVSFDVYGSPYYWWAILVVNDIKNIWDKNLVGSIIKCPNLLDIQDFVYRGGR